MITGCSGKILRDTRSEDVTIDELWPPRSRPGLILSAFRSGSRCWPGLGQDRKLLAIADAMERVIGERVVPSR
jgi:hypothetical protein